LISGIKLEVRDNSSNPATVRITDTGQNPELQWQYNTGANDHWSIYVDKSDSNKLKVWGVGSSGDNRLTVTTDGKLGVGTANPSQKLHVYDTGNVRVRVESVSQTLAAELELMAKNSAGTTKEWHLYTMGNVTPANSLIFWSSDSSNVMAITQAGALGVGTINPSYKIDVQGGQINASGGLCIAGECKTAWSQVGGYPSNIKETTNLAGIHNADFSIYGGASNNGWQGIKNFALANGCDSTWHVCQGWELSYIYSQDYSTAGCNNIFSGLSGDGSDACLGWVIGQFTESIIEVEGDFVEAGDCYGYKSSAVDKYHAAVWYVDQWGTAECSDALPVLCCQ